jgi:hypothetical protein
MDKSIKRNLQIIKEERERKQISISIVESRLSTIMGGKDFFVRYNSLSENKKAIPYGYVSIRGDNLNSTTTYDALPYGLIQSRVVLRVRFLFDLKKNFSITLFLI